MRNLFFIALIAILAFSCGDAGIGFNIRKEFPVEFPVEIPSSELGIPGINPPAVTREEVYSLSEAGFDDLEYLEEVVVNSLAYEITGVDAKDQIDLDAMKIELISKNTTIAVIDITSNQLQNVTKTTIGTASGLAALQSALDNQEDITARTTFDFAEIPANQIDFNFVLFFDVTIKVRDLGE